MRLAERRHEKRNKIREERENGNTKPRSRNAGINVFNRHAEVGRCRA